MLLLWRSVHRSVAVRIRHVWLRYEIYQHNNVVILNTKFNECCNTMYIRWFLSVVWWIVVQTALVKKKTTVFAFRKEEHLRKTWIKFVIRKDWETTNLSYIWIKHFEDKYYQKGEGNKRFRLIKTLKPVPTIFDPSNPNFCNSSACQVTSPVSIPRKSPRKRLYQEDKYQSFLADDVIKNFSDINKNICPSGYLFQQYGDGVVFFKLTNSHMLTPEVTGCIQVDSELHVKLFFKGCFAPLPQWFRKGQNCRLLRKNMLGNFPVYLKSDIENISLYLTDYINICSQRKLFTQPKLWDMHC